MQKGVTNRQVQERFLHSSETVSQYFNKVLKIICLLAIDIIKLEDSKFLNTPREITMNPRFMPYFKVRQMVFLAINDKEKIVSNFGFLFMKCWLLFSLVL